MKVYVVTEENTYEEWWIVLKVFSDKEKAYEFANYEKNESAVPSCFIGYRVYEMELD